MKKPPKRKKKTATVPSPTVAGKRRRRTKAEREFEEAIEELKDDESWEPKPWTRDYEGEARRGANVAAVRDRMETAGEMISVIFSDAIHAEGAESYAAECLAEIVDKTHGLLEKVAARTEKPAAAHARQRLQELGQKIKAARDREAQRRTRAKKGLKTREAGDRFRRWAEKIVTQVERRRQSGQKDVLGVRLPETPFAMPRPANIAGQSPETSWRNCLMLVMEKLYKEEARCPDGPSGKWKNRRRHAKQVIDGMWKRAIEDSRERHRRWVQRDQAGHY